MKKLLPQTLANRILREIISLDEVSDMDRLPTVRTLTKRFDVANATIAEACSILESQGYLVRKHGSGSFIRKKAGVAKRKKTGLKIGLILPHYHESSVIPDLLRGIELTCQERNLELEIRSSGSSIAAEKKVFKSMVRDGYDGLIIYPQPRTVEQQRNDYLKDRLQGPALVIVGLAYRDMRHCSVVFDNFYCGYEITRRLLKEGHQRIVFCRFRSADGALEHRANHDRYQGYLAAHADFGVLPHEEDCWYEVFDATADFPDEDALRNKLVDWSDGSGPRPTAIIAVEDFRAALLVSMATDLDIHVPKELRIVGFGNIKKYRDTLNFPTTDSNHERAGSMSVDLLTRQINGFLTRPIDYMMPVEVVWPS
ncbi:GntR family transcriptional regulator [Coraliomargarita sp. W4R53]